MSFRTIARQRPRLTLQTAMPTSRKKLIEVALPLDVIDTASAREESVICVSTDGGI